MAKRKVTLEEIEERLCGVAEAAKLLGKSQAQVKAYCIDGTLGAFKVKDSRAWTIDRESVRQLAEELDA